MSLIGEDESGSAERGTLATAWRLLRGCAAGEGRRMVGGLLLLGLANLVALLQPWPLKLVLDGVLGGQLLPLGMDRLGPAISAAHPKIALLVVLCGALLLIHLLSAALNVVSTASLVATGLRMVFGLRCRLFDHIQRLSLRFHDANTVGDSLYRITWDSYCIQSIFNSGLVPAITSTLTLLGIGLVMLSRDWLLTAVTAAVAVPLLLLVRWMDRPMAEHSMRARQRESEISARVQETLGGIRAVQAFGQEAFESERFRDQAQSSLRASLRLTVLQTASQAVVGLVLAGGTAIVIGIGAYRVLQGRLTPGDVWLMVAYIGMLFRPLETLAYGAATIQGSIASARRVLAILDRQPDVADLPGAVELSARAAGRICLERVCFAYAPDRPVLRNVDLEIPAGATLALVGPSGAGKTTLVSLVMRFYDPSGGRILLDDRDLRGIRLQSLRGSVALVLQESVLFSATVGENIAYGRPGAGRQQIEAAARAAGAHEFIMQLAQQYATPIGERGVSLSGGQRQRLSIARAFLKDAPILVMDEPTSALDAASEGELLEALSRLRAGRTTIIIAHRLSTIRDADVIAVMKEGTVGEMGTHVDLLAGGGLYAQLHAMQLGQVEDSEGTGGLRKAMGAGEGACR